MVLKGLIQGEPKQIKMKKYPTNSSGRSFSTFHYFRRLPNGERIKRTWIIYSKSSDSVYCFCCKLFNNGMVSLATIGNSDWKNMSNILNRHEMSPIHKKSYEDWKELETRFKCGKTIDDINQSSIKNETEYWKNILKRIIALILTISKQNLALRGKSDTLNSHDNGNFLKCIEFLSMFDPIMKEHIRRISSEEIHCHYLGKNIQNEVIRLLANKIRSHILNELKNSKYYSIILDCTPDLSNIEQMTVIVRFVTAIESTTSKKEHVSINEHFIDFIELHSTTGLNMTEVILQKLKEMDIPISDMRGQGYDNGANMRGHKSGVQARIRNINSRAFYVPCNAHSLNLVLNDSASCCLEAVLFFNTIQETYVFFSASTQRWGILLKHVKHLTVKPLSQTRWSSRVDAIRAMRFQVGEIYDALKYIIDDTSLIGETGVRSRAEAKGIALKLKSFILFLYNISSTDNYEYVMKCCKDLEIALTSDDSLSSDINAIELCEEIIALHRRLKKEESDPQAILQYICKNKLIEIFPNVYVALRILLTIPVTAASAERSFSKLKIIKNYLRSTISQDRLVGLATISIEHEIADNLDIDDLVKDFAALKARKLNF